MTTQICNRHQCGPRLPGLPSLVILLFWLFLPTGCDSSDESENRDTSDTADTSDTSISPALSLVATAEARYCVAPSHYSASSLSETLAEKGELTLTPGSYPLIEGSFVLPATVTLVDGTILSNAHSGTLTQSFEGIVNLDFGDSGLMRIYSISQSLSDGSGNPYTFRAAIGVLESSAQVRDNYVLDGTQWAYTYAPPPLEYPESFLKFWICTGDSGCADNWQNPGFGRCGTPGNAPAGYTVQFNGGDVSLDMHVGQYFYGTEAATFTRAYGTLDGVSFDQTDYYKLAYLPENHHFIQNYAILFDTPIGDACGLTITSFSPDDHSMTAVNTVDCDLNPIQNRVVLQ